MSDYWMGFMFGFGVGCLFTLWMGCNGDYYEGYFANVTDYEITTACEYTKSGICVHTNGQEVDLDEIDIQTEQLEQCIGFSIHRDWFKVYVPSDWYLSPCSGQQLVPSTVDPALCEAKGIEPTPECPCNIRAEVQEAGKIDMIVTTPNLALYKQPLARIVLFPEYVYPDYAHCM